jgi:hypothetical protein
LIEKVRTNIALQSQTFDDAGWSKVLASVTANVTTAPDGTLTAEKLIEDSSALVQHRLDQTTTSAVGTNTFSVFAKKSERTEIAIRIGFNGTIFNLDLGTIVTNLGTTPIATIQDAGNGWYRCSITSVCASANEAIRINLASAGEIAYTGNGTSGIFIWGAQLEVSDFGATDYIPTTTAAVSVGITANIPRLDYTGGGCPSWLLEPQRTNFITYSEQFNNAAWTSASFTVGANTTISPDGNLNADTLPFTASASSNIFTFPTTAVTGAHTFSIYAKVASGTKQFRLRIDTGSGPEVSSDLTATTNWQRFTLPFTSTNVNLVAYVFNNTGGTAGDLIVWGAQVEAGAYATSYIPTLGSSVTRLADAASKTGISSLIGQTEGTLFAEFSVPTNENINRSIGLNDGTTDNRINITIFGVSVFARVDVGGVNQVNANASIVPTDMNKIALTYSPNNFALYLNGVKVITDTNGNTFSGSVLNSLSFIQPDGTAQFSGSVKSIIFYKTALSDTEAIELTTL